MGEVALVYGCMHRVWVAWGCRVGLGSNRCRGLVGWIEKDM